MLLHAHERVGGIEKLLVVSTMAIGPRGEVRDRPIDRGLQTSESPEPIGDAIDEVISRLVARDEMSSAERGQHGFDVGELGNPRDMPQIERDGRERRQRHEDAPLLLVDPGQHLGDQGVGRQVLAPSVERDPALADDGRRVADSKGMPSERLADIGGCRMFRRIECALEVAFE